MPTPEEVATQNLTWETQVVKTYETIKWARNAIREERGDKTDEGD